MGLLFLWYQQGLQHRRRPCCKQNIKNDNENMMMTLTHKVDVRTFKNVKRLTALSDHLVERPTTAEEKLNKNWAWGGENIACNSNCADTDGSNCLAVRRNRNLAYCQKILGKNDSIRGTKSVQQINNSFVSINQIMIHTRAVQSISRKRWAQKNEAADMLAPGTQPLLLICLGTY
jgi:hypothetical protein